MIDLYKFNPEMYKSAPFYNFNVLIRVYCQMHTTSKFETILELAFYGKKGFETNVFI